jgi:Flp pilus assembly protein TadG
MHTAQRIGKVFSHYVRHTAGAIAVIFALMAPLIIGAAGFALDFAQAYLVQQRLAQALDAAALAAAASSTDENIIEQKVREFFDANYPPEKIGVTFVPDVHIVGNEVIVTGYANYLTFFLNVIGIHFINVNAETVVQREVQGLEVVMVLDNTGSMAENDNIGALKEATRSFINILFERTSNPDYIRIGMVPYSNSVRVGSYGRGLNPDGSAYDGDTFVTLPSGINSTTNHDSSSGWYGCVVEHKNVDYNAAATHVSNSYGQLWRTGSGSGCNSTANCKGHGWAPNSTTNNPYPYDTLDTWDGPWDIYMYGKVISSGQQCSGSGYSSSRCSNCSGSNSTCASTYCYCRYSTPNEGCPYAQVVPLTSDQEYLLDQVEDDTSAEPDDMEPEGNTLGNIGMVWGYRLLSPEPPFEEANDWANPYWRKAVVMMTDGDNTENGTYSSYWFTNKNDMSVTKFNQRFEQTCEALKERGVTVYTVTFTSNINDDTKDYYRRCASSDDQYYDAPSQEELIDVFETISRELSNLHISG